MALLLSILDLQVKRVYLKFAHILSESLFQDCQGFFRLTKVVQSLSQEINQR